MIVPAETWNQYNVLLGKEGTGSTSLEAVTVTKSISLSRKAK